MQSIKFQLTWHWIDTSLWKWESLYVQYNLRILQRNYTRFICRNSYFGPLPLFVLICSQKLDKSIKEKSSNILEIQNAVVWI